MSIPSTVLLPTDEAWYTFLESAGVCEDAIDQLTGLQVTETAEGLSILFYSEGPGIVQTTVNLTDIVLYHEIPEVVVTSANLTNGMSLPTAEGANITVRVNPTSPNPTVTFISAANGTATAGSSGNSTGATVVAADILVKGNTSMHIISAVLVPY